LLAFEEVSSSTGSDIWVLPMEGDRKPKPFLQTRFSERTPKLSPDGRWMAYSSNESGRFEVYVQPFPGPGGKWLVSGDGGGEPVWARSGRELFYRNGDKMMAVEVATEGSFSVGKTQLLFEGVYLSLSGLTSFDVTPDGRRFVMIRHDEPALPATQLNVVLNWFEELRRRRP